jgi:hypothetical protein
MEAGGLETFYGRSQIQQPERGSFLQHAQRPHYGDSAFLRPFSPFSVVNYQLVGVEFYRKHNRVAFARV